ncbi:aspartic peptidase domain-containing protein [Pisolithus microcarpus]|nr:aspartic peptidase domain-containing protein [Pisolithus microcarpus]
MNGRDTSITQGMRIPLRNVDVIGGHDFWVVFDTGSADLWVASTDCTTEDCHGVPKYSQAESHTLNLSGEPFSLNYLSGSVVGIVGTETIEFGWYQIASQTFALADQTSGLNLADMGNSGILGFAFPSIAAIQPALGTTVLENIFDHLGDERRFFGYTLGRNTGTSSDSSITIGELDSSIVNDSSQLSYFPVFRTTHSPYDFWKLPIQSLTINSLSLPLSHSLVPGAIFWNTVNVGNSVRYNNDSQKWEVRCDRAIDVRDVKMPWCTGGLQANDGVNSGDWILGDSFLRVSLLWTHPVILRLSFSTRPALIGLLNLTDPQTALLDFQKIRGQDPIPLPTSSVLGQLSRPQTRDIVIAIAVCASGGLIIGIIATLVYRSCGRSQGTVGQNGTA